MIFDEGFSPIHGKTMYDLIKELINDRESRYTYYLEQMRLKDKLIEELENQLKEK